MKIRPISIVAPQVHLLNAGLLTRLFRPVGSVLSAVEPGDLLWVREPFVLAARYDTISPSQAERLGGAPVFTSDLDRKDRDLRKDGRTRNARELLRIWHRQHLRVTAVGRRPVQSLTLRDLQGQGYSLAESFAADWDRNLALVRSAAGAGRWNENPEAIVLDFERIAGPVPAEGEMAA